MGAEPHKFQPGQSGNPAGKKKGTQNRLTVEVKSMVEEALKQAGKNTQKKRRTLKELEPGVAYLAHQAELNPVAFMSLVGKLIPQKIDMDVQIMSQGMVALLEERRQQLNDLKTIDHQSEEEETNDSRKHADSAGREPPDAG